MALYDNQSVALEPRAEQRSWFGPIGQRFLSLLRGRVEHRPEGRTRRLAPWTGQEPETVEAPVLPRFPIARHGYDRIAVDGYVSELEQELAALDHELVELRARIDPAEEVASQIKRIGEQTSAVLMAANEQREEILRAARAEAERCVAEAGETARTLTEQGEVRLRELEAQTQAAQSERERLLGELRTISAALAAVADSAQSG